MSKTPVLLIFLLLPTIVSGVIINEIMYNPSGNEFDFEYVELLGDEDISGWYFEGIDFTFPENTSIQDYLVVVNTLGEEGENNDFKDRYPSVDVSFEFKGSLLNEGEVLILRNKEGNIIDIVDYDDWAEENHSIERKQSEGYSSDPNNWAQSILGGTPGVENSISQSEGCDWELQLLYNSSITDDPEWKVRASKIFGEGKATATISLWIEDSFGNVKRRYSDLNFENMATRKTSSTYSPPLAKGEGYLIKANISHINCEDNNKENNALSELLFVRKEQKNTQQHSQIYIQSISSTSKFGDEVKVRMNVYRGNTSKYAVSAVITDDTGKTVSEKSSMQFRNKFTNYSITVPIQLKPNCKGTNQNGEYVLLIEGLDTIVEDDVNIEGNVKSLCQTIEVEKKSSTGKLTYDITQMPSIIYEDEPFEINIVVENEDDEDVDVEITNYVYRGRKKYSVESVEKVTIEEDDTREITLENIMTEGETGDYKFKIKLKKQGRKTTIDKTRDVHFRASELQVVEQKEQIATTTSETKEQVPQEIEKEITFIRESDFIYQSKTFFIKELIPYFLLALFFLAMLFAIVSFKEKSI